MSETDRKTLALLIGGVHTHFPKHVLKGIIQEGKKHNVDILFFLGAQTQKFFSDILTYRNTDSFDYQFNTIYDYSMLCKLDGILINYGTIGMYLEDNDVHKFANKYNYVPVVFITENVDLPNCYSVIADNYQGMCNMIKHLVEVHECKKLLFVSGPRKNRDAVERLQAYKDMMDYYHFPVTDTMIAEGDFSEFVDEQVEAILERNPDADAIVCANDEMAMSAYHVCERKGLRIGKDIKITGFDNSDICKTSYPPLSTISQDGVLMGEVAVQNMMKVLENQPIQNVRVDVDIIERESCGCKKIQESDYDKGLNYANEMVDLKQQFWNLHRKTWLLPILSRELSNVSGNDREFCYVLMNNIQKYQVERAFLFLLDEPKTFRNEQEWQCPDDLRLAGYCDADSILAYQEYERPLVSKDCGIEQYVKTKVQDSYMVFLLFSGEKQYGLLVCTMPLSEFDFFYMLSLQIGISLNYHEMIKSQNALRNELMKDMEVIRAQNKELDIVSGHDGLTGILNRRGLLRHAEQYKTIEGKRNHNCYIAYMDMDHLKEINDTWGHKEGDFAIRACVSVMKSCLRENDLFARIGGDEFICLIFADTDGFEELFQKRFKEAFDSYNAQSDKPYYVEASLGLCKIILDENCNLEVLMEEADKELYEAKQRRRPSVKK